MKISLITILLIGIVFSQIPSGLMEKIKADEILSEGGADLIEWNLDSTYIVGVFTTVHPVPHNPYSSHHPLLSS